MVSGGCCRSPSMTMQMSDSARRKPSRTAPPRPAVGASRWTSRTGICVAAATRSTAAGVSSVESSTKRISRSSPSVAAWIRRTSSAMFGASLKVGTMMERSTAHPSFTQRSPDGAVIDDARISRWRDAKLGLSFAWVQRRRDAINRTMITTLAARAMAARSRKIAGNTARPGHPGESGAPPGIRTFPSRSGGVGCPA